MMTKEHAKSLKEQKNNTGSCRDYAKYLCKENTHFFNHSSSEIEVEEAISLIDSHGVGQLGKTEAKWYAPIYSLSEEESQFICYNLFNENFTDYDELNEEQKVIFNNYIIELAKKFQDTMAANFNKENLGISTGEDLVYVGVVENERTYKEFDEAVKSGLYNMGDSKPGFNTHIHIIQSRKANNLKKSKISPISKNKNQFVNNLNAKVGFDRNAFYLGIEKTFDIFTKYNRTFNKSFEFFKEKSQIKNNIIPKKSKKDKMKKFYSKEEIERISQEASLLNYFNSLVDKGILKYFKVSSGVHYYGYPDQNVGKIAVTSSGWKDFRDAEKGGKIIKAMQKFEGLEWIDAIKRLDEQTGYTSYVAKNEVARNAVAKSKNNPNEENSSVVSYVGSVNNKYILNYFRKDRGISDKIVKANLVQVYYESKGRKFYTAGIENNSGGFNVRGKGFKSVVGKHNDFSIIRGNNAKAIVFEGMLEYLSYLEMLNRTKIDETVFILNSITNSNSLIEFLNQNQFDEIDLLLNGDQPGTNTTNKLLEAISYAKDVRAKFNIKDKLDLNDKLNLNRLIDDIQSLFNRNSRNLKLNI